MKDSGKKQSYASSEQGKLPIEGRTDDRSMSSEPVTCLGITFETEEACRAHFTEELRKKLKDSEFRKIEGFPIGSDEDILYLSDPPYYTACPNSWTADYALFSQISAPEGTGSLRPKSSNAVLPSPDLAGAIMSQG